MIKFLLPVGAAKDASVILRAELVVDDDGDLRLNMAINDGGSVTVLHIGHADGIMCLWSDLPENLGLSLENDGSIEIEAHRVES